MQFSHYQISHAKLKVTDFAIKSTMKNLQLSIESFLVEIKFKVLSKDGLEHVDISILFSNCENFWILKILDQGKIDLFFQRFLQWKYKDYDWNLDGASGSII